MVRSTNLRMLTVYLFYQVIKNILDQLERLSLEDAGLRTRIGQLRTLFNAYDALMRRTQGSSNTQGLLDYDARRDDLLRGLQLVIQGYSFSPQREKAEAARLLLRFYNTYGNGLTELAQLKETAVITNLLQDFRKPEGVAALERLSPTLRTDWIAPLEEANRNFEALYSTRAQDLHVEETGLPTKTRDEAQEAFDKVGRRLNSLLELAEDEGAPNPEYAKAAQIINTEVETAKANQRRGGGAGDTPPQP